MTGHRIDIHAHFPVDIHHRSDAPWSAWDTDRAVRGLDELHIQRQYLSLPALPVAASGHPEESAALARSANDALAAVIAERPERFGAFATAPGDDIDAATREIERALNLGLHGIGLCSNVQGRYLGDPWFEPLFAEAQHRGIPIFVHPAISPVVAPLTLGRPAFLVEYPLDTFRSVIDAVFAGVFVRFPGLKMIVAHCGGALPALAWRIRSLAPLIPPENRAVDVADVDAALRSLYLDTALSGAAEVIASALQLVGPDHLLYGTDSGAANSDLITHNTKGLTSAVTPDQLRRIEHDNAANLLGH